MKRKPKNPITKIRTGTGDAGSTYLHDPDVSKASDIVQFAGELDEASASLGFVDIDHSHISCETVDIQIQMNGMLNQTKEILFTIGAMIHSDQARNDYQAVLDEYVELVSDGIVSVTHLAQEHGFLIPLEGFIIPDKNNAPEMFARAVVRRAERSAVKSKQDWAVPALNVMSDFLFLIAWHNSKTLDQWLGFDTE